VSEFVFIEQAPVQGAERSVESGTTIGREGCDITLTDPDVSRRHAAIRIAAGEVTIEDLGSTNGTLVNGENITEPRTLRDGDEVRIGSAIWRLRAPAAATRLSDVPSEVATASQATTLRPAATPAPEPPTEEAAPAPSEAAPAPSEAAPAPSERAPAPMSAAAAPAPSRAPSRRGDVPLPDFAPSAIRRIVPTEATTAFTPETQGGRRGSAATRGGATLFTTIVIAATTVGVVVYYITEPFK
jgi:predicted component of type VI protein secretion system